MPEWAAASTAVCPRKSQPSVAILTRTGVARIMRFAFDLARSRPRKLLTVVTKSNAQRHGMVMWDEIAAEVAADYPDVDLGQDAGRCHDHAHDAAARRPSTRSSPPICTPTSCPIWPRRSRARLASRRPRTSIPSASFPPCSSRSTARPSTSPARASPIPIGTFWTAVDDAGTPRREPDGARRLMRAIERVDRGQGVAHARSRRPRDNARRDVRRVRGAGGG